MSSVRYEILDLLTEDDYGPWEVLVQVEHSRAEIVGELEKLIARRAVEWALRDGYNGATRTLSENERPSLLSDGTWVASEFEDPQLLMRITDLGLEEHSKLMRIEFDWPPRPEGSQA